MKATVFTINSLFKIGYNYSLDGDWFENFALPSENSEFRRVQIGDIIYFFEISLDDDNVNIVVIADNILKNSSDSRITFDRISTVARRIFTNSVNIPESWRPHYEENIWSIYAASRRIGHSSRIHFDTAPCGNSDLFVFSRTDTVVDFQKLPTNIDVYKNARKYFADAILASDVSNESEPSGHAGIVLNRRLPQGFTQGATLDEWYQAKLTDEQRAFVDKAHDGPVRLRGSAGTGKTLALTIKFLKDGLQFEERSQDSRLCFITHSSASVDLVDAICASLDSRGLYLGAGSNCKLEIRTIYDLAQEYLRFDLSHLEPLSLDGREGRQLQYELIGSVLLDMWKSKIVRSKYSNVSKPILERWKSAVKDKEGKLIIDIMNEFASVLDSEGIRAREEKGERYVRGSSHRPKWLMELETEIDRRFMLDVHLRYRELLGNMNTLSIDQMVADFDSFLDSNRWDRIKGRDGYDAIFVDELQLFSSIERQILHKLIKPRLDKNGVPMRPPIFMAYDIKQSPKDSFTHYIEGSKTIFGPKSGLQNSKLFELSKVFRYTPEIAQFLEDLDASFPAIDIPGEWNAYTGLTQLENGNVPDLIEFQSDLELFRNVMKHATKVARKIDGGGRRVAVLCCSENSFDKYLSAIKGQYTNSCIPIEDRDPVTNLRHAGKRFVFSMPEYVSGLQFDTVFLINVDSYEAPTDAGPGVRRRFVSIVYLGASRSEKSLHISASIDGGGASDILQLAIDRGNLIEKAAD